MHVILMSNSSNKVVVLGKSDTALFPSQEAAQRVADRFAQLFPRLRFLVLPLVSQQDAKAV